MTRIQLKGIAKTRGLIIRNMKEENIIRMIQRADGKAECFSSAKGEACSQHNCLWSSMCQDNTIDQTSTPIESEHLAENVSRF
jgi:hypothetical protein